MAKEQNMEENKAGAEKASQPKKKKITAVFHKQNSTQNSLKSRPAGSGQRRPAGKRPAGSRPAPGTHPAEGAAKRPAGNGQRRPAAQTAEGQAARPRTRTQAAEGQAAKSRTRTQAAEGQAARPRTRTQAAEGQAAKPRTGKTPAAQGQTAKPRTVQSEDLTEKKAKSLTPEKPEKETAAAAKSAEMREVQTGAGQTSAEAKEKAPEKPVRRFVDMEQVRAADRAEKNRTERARNQNRNGRTGQTGRPGDRNAGAGRSGQAGGHGNGNGAGRPGERSFHGNDRNAGRPGDRNTGRGGQNRGGEKNGRSSGPELGRRGGATRAQNQKGNPKNQKNNTRFNRSDSDEMRRPGGKGKGSAKELTRPGKPAKKKAEEPEIRTLVLPASLTVRELADKMKVAPAVLVKKLFLAGKMVTVNDEIDYETASEIAMDYDILTEEEVQVNVIEELLKDTTVDPEESLVPRPPVVCVMGHVDHGKTSLLDAIRNTNVTAGEAGGITQAIGASVVEVNGQKITFLDTPGHEAFTAMRMRGAQSTDIAILVVAADDGVMPQTVEAINHARAAGVEIIVAINKIDKPGANVERVKQELTEHDLVAEDWGGSNIFVPVSAKTGEGIDELLESILLVAEVMELKANPNRNARGVVIEAQLDKGRGPVATVLVQKGTLHVGDFVAIGSCYGKVRAMINPRGRRVKTAGPSDPVEILGLNDVPNAGDVFVSPDTEKEARSYAETFIAEARKKLIEDTKSRMSLDDLFSQIQAGNVKELDVIIKADVQGSVEALRQSLLKLSGEEVVVKVIHGGVGAITESDVTLASASNAIIIGFNVRPDAQARSLADEEKVDIRLYDVIYKAIEDVEAAMKGMLDPVYEESVIGHAVVRQLFKASAVGTIAGSYVTDGKISRGCKCRISRDGKQIFDGNLASLRRFKDDVKEVLTGFECGLVFEKFNDIREDDTIEAYVMVEVPRV